ncbi:MAG: hypothetical protein U5K53_00395 [Halanaerobiales bacterium]|nr:hypothetical protein [Halanaerobiales bacterium]
MNVKKEYMKLFRRNLFLNKNKSKKVIKEVSEDVDHILSKYDDDRVAFDEEMEPAIYRALRLTKENTEYLEDLGFINAIKYSSKVPHLNLKTKMKVGNLPLINITSGINNKKGDYDVAKGVVAIGNKARGIIALGKMAYGVIAIGAVSIGIISFGVLSAGVFSVAAIAFALLLSLGGISISAIASLGVLSISSLAASGQIAMAHFVKSANKVSENIPGWFEFLSNNMTLILLIFEIILVAVALVIFYFDFLSKYKYNE